MRNPVLLAAAAAMALSAPVFAQPVERDHRTPKAEPTKRDHRKSEVVPAVRGKVRGGPSITDYTPKTGPAGTQVTVTGTGLRRVKEVLFGTQMVTPDSATPTQLVFTVPDIDRPGARRITLKHPSGDLTVGSFRARRGERVPAEKAEPPPGGPPPHGVPPRRLPPPRGVHRWHRERVTVASYSPHEGKPGTRKLRYGKTQRKMR